jgi:alpha-mannosidase
VNPETRTRLDRDLQQRPAAEIAAWLRRADLQMQFARAFTDTQPAQETIGWADLIAQAQALLDGVGADAGVAGLAAAVQAAEQAMAPIGQAARRYRIHCVGHGHIDMNWMWSWPETVASTYDTFASVLNLMEQYPDLTYSQSQASVYALVEKYYPAMFAEIQRHVKAGRWEVSAVHWVEGEKNLASGESLCRHLLYTRSYFRDKFGLTPEEMPLDWEPDTFGHAVTVPGILTQGGVKYYYSCRTGGGFEHPRIGEPRPPLFYWQAPNGARVLVNRETTWYNSYVNIGDNIALPMVAFVKETGLHHWLNVYGIGNHGGGPTRTEIDYYHTMQEWPIYPEITFSTAIAYFKAIEAEAEAAADGHIPVLAHELNFEFPGCYTSQSAIKRGNRFGENYLEEAETLAALAAQILGQPYPTAQLREAWLNVLFNQFHDILPGSGVRETREHAAALFQEVGAITGAIKRNAGQALAAQIDTVSLLPANWDGEAEQALVQTGRANTAFVAGTGIGAGLTGYSQANSGGKRFLPYVVYNPCAWPRSERVQVALYDTDFAPGRIVARDETGKAHPTLFLGKGSDWGHEKLNVAFDAVDVPALGYRTYLLCEGSAAPPANPVAIAPGEWFETPYFRFRVDRYQSGLLELIDKRTGAILIDGGAGPLGAWEYLTERPRGMTSWVIGKEMDNLTLRSSSFSVVGAARNQGTSVPNGGPTLGYRIDSVLEVPGTQSTVRVSLMIHALEPRLDFTADLDWREIGDPKRGIPGLVIRFPLALRNPTSLYEAPFGSVERHLFAGEEVPTLRYAHITGTAPTAEGGEVFAGVTLLQDSKYGHALNGSELRLRIVRSSFDPDHAPEVARSTMRYALLLHDTPATPADLARLGAGWNHPFLLIPANLQTGIAPARQSFARVVTPNVVLTALKQAEEGSGLVLRLVEMNGQDTEAVVELDPSVTQGLTAAVCLDLMERPVEGSVEWQDGTLKVSVPALDFVTVRLSRD